MKKTIIPILLTVVCLLSNPCPTTAQMQQALPIDPQVRYGKLDNGLSYYIRANRKPKNRAEFYIAQNVGAILENDDQNGLAHFLEHMAFNGTKNFPGKGIINYFESIGVRFGENINAYTSLDETVYNLSDVPTTRESILDSALLVLHDWSNFISLEGAEIDAERGVIREEWRTGAHAERRMWKEGNKQKYPGSQYAKRDVIGDTAVINNFAHKALRDFYKRWYRPDLQAILIVGDIDVDQIEAKIQNLFSDIPPKENAGERPIYSIPDNKEPIIAVVKDREANYARIELLYKKDRLPSDFRLSINGYAFSIVNSLISQMLNYRFQELVQNPEAASVAAIAHYGKLVKSKDAFITISVPKEGQELKSIEELAIEGERMRRYGFTQSELERAKTALLARMEKAYNERDNQENNKLVQQYVRHFLDDESIPGLEWEYQMLQNMLPEISQQMVNDLAKTYVTDDNLIISINAPEKTGLSLPSETEILATVKKVRSMELSAKEEETPLKNLITQVPKAGKIKKTSANTSLGSIEWLLSNGVKVIIKPTEFKQDEILFTAFSQGGLSKVANRADLPSAMLAEDIVGVNGLGEFNKIELNKALTGKNLTLTPYIASYNEGLKGNSSVKDFETLLQLIYLHFTGIRKDEKAYQALMNMLHTGLVNADSNPRRAFSDSIAQMNANHHPREITIKLNTLQEVNQDKALQIFRERFGNAADFTFVFAGNINPEDNAVKQAILSYLGGLKTQKTREKFDDHGIRKPKGKAIKQFERTMETQTASNYVAYSASMPYNLKNLTTLSAIANILSKRYIDSVREKEGGSYGVTVRGGVGNIPIEEAVLYMQFDTDPEKQDRIIDIIYAEVDEIIKKGPRTEDLQKVKENLLKQHSQNLEENQWWRHALSLYYKDGLNLIQDYKASVEGLTPESIRETLKGLVSQNNLIHVLMMPKK